MDAACAVANFAAPEVNFRSTRPPAALCLLAGAICKIKTQAV
jgi:hypothetical protein